MTGRGRKNTACGVSKEEGGSELGKQSDILGQDSVLVSRHHHDNTQNTVSGTGLITDNKELGGLARG